MRQTWLMTVVILLLTFLSDQWCHCCLEEERIALLDIKTWIDPEDFYLSDWVHNIDDSDCCSWNRVKCDNTTNRVTEINLSRVRFRITPEDLYLNASLFLSFQDLKFLDLSCNNLVGCYENRGGGSILLESLGALSSLNILDLSFSNFSGMGIVPGFCNLTNLEKLVLDFSYLSTSFLRSIEALSSLKVLSLSACHLQEFPPLQGLEMLEELYLNRIINTTGGSIWLESLGALPSLKILDLSENDLNRTGIVPELYNLINLEQLLLSSSSLSINFSQSIGALSSLKILSLDRCNLQEFPSLQGLKLLEELYLNDINIISGRVLVDSLGAFPSLKTLHLMGNNGNGTVIGPGLYNLTKLENLYLDDSSQLETNFLQKIGSLSALKVLFLFGFDLKSTLPTQGWCELKNVEQLDLRETKLEGPLPACLGNMTSLRSLNVSQNNLVGDIASNPLSSLTSLEYLSIQNNHFQIPSSFKSFMNLSNLKFLSCGDNNVITEPTINHDLIPKFQLRYFSFPKAFPKEVPHFLYTQYDLRFVDLSRNNINELFPFWMIENNTKLEAIRLEHNSFKWSLQLRNHSSHDLIAIDISNNKIYGEIFKDICSLFPTLEVLFLANNELFGDVPPCIGNMSSLYYLDLSNNFLTSGSFEQLILLRLSSLKLSNNNLDGERLPSLLNSSSNLRDLYLDGNNFEGQIWEFSSITSSLSLLDISNNRLSGKLPNWISNASYLEVIDMSKNQFRGHIPTEFCKLDHLEFLDISENDLSGSIPSCFKFNLPYITHIHLHKNQLSGQLTDSFANSSFLVTLDLGYNNLVGLVPNWIGNLSALEVLLLRANHFYGGFPVGLCSSKQLSILDFSKNKLTGSLPSCLGNLSFSTITSGKTFSTSFVEFYGEVEFFPAEIVDEVIEFTTKRNSYNYSGDILNFMSGIDLSCNNFIGEIPAEVGYLTKIQALNLSHNNLRGTIPTTLSNLQHIESLDLSYNNLIGEIPSQLTQLTSLEVFNVSYNNLSGEIPEMKNQFGTFDEYSYEGNPFLCGPLLQNNCNGEESPSLSKPDDSNKDQKDIGFIDMEVFYVSFGVCYITVVLTIAVILCINPYWRRRWFYFIEVCIDTCYYFMIDCYYYMEDIFCR